MWNGYFQSEAAKNIKKIAMKAKLIILVQCSEGI